MVVISMNRVGGGMNSFVLRFAEPTAEARQSLSGFGPGG
jgi:hypothetical protein